MVLLFTILGWMSSLAPGRDHIEAATAIATVAIEQRALFADDTDRFRTASLLTAIAFRESSLRNDVTSKTGDSCMMQVNRRPDLASDPTECVRVAVTMLRESMRMCPDHPLSLYAEGPRGCTSSRAQRISRDRMALASRLRREVTP